MLKNHVITPHTPEQKKIRKEQVLTHGIPSITHSISDAVVIKNEGIYFLTKPDGTVPLGGNHGFGLYYHDCRYLNGYDLRLGGHPANPLTANASLGFEALFELSNPDIHPGTKEEAVTDQTSSQKPDRIPMNQVGIRWERVIDAKRMALFEWMSFHNYGQKPVRLPVDFTFQAGFEDVFDIRGLLKEKPGKLNPPRWEGGKLKFSYSGADHLERELTISFSTPPSQTKDTSAHFDFSIEPGKQQELILTFFIEEEQENKPETHKEAQVPDLEILRGYLKDESKVWLQKVTDFTSNNLLLNQVLDRCLHDLRTLQSNLDQLEYLSAGVPWFVALFGRDSAISAYQMLAFNPDLAAQTARLLAKYQGTKVDHWRDETPGKILHEIRVGELANINAIPYNPYYGSIDSTPLFLILIARHAQWTGKLDLFNELRDNINQALEWMDRYGDANGDGYLEYVSASPHGQINQGWKDSGDAIVNADGSLARSPISVVEVQGYAYMARLEIADLFERTGDHTTAEKLRQAAEKLKTKFNQDFWLPDLNFYALALQGDDNQPAAVISSNPGQALWTGIIDPEKAGPTVQRLMHPDMFAGWGIRTLSTREKAYNPTGYHLGTIWPHDNAIIASGFRRYHFDKEAVQIFSGILQAAMHLPDYRLPELFSGFRMEDYHVPVRFPVACHPQAWAAGSVPLFLTELLGLQPNAFEKELHIVRPVLPDYLERIKIRSMRVGEAQVNLDFERTPSGKLATRVVDIQGELNVIVDEEAKT